MAHGLRWEVPAGWESPLRLPELRELHVHTIAFVTTFRPSAAVALAAKTNPAAVVLVLAKPEHRQRVAQLGAVWADVDANASSVRRFASMYRQSVGGSPAYWRFCHSRWLLLAAHLRVRPPPRDGAVVVLDDDVLLFERVEQRLRGLAAQKPQAHVDTAINGAFLLASAPALQRFAAFLWALYALPAADLVDVAWQFGNPAQLSALPSRLRSRIDPVMIRNGRYPVFTDMDSMNAFRLLSRRKELPENLRVRWSTGFRRGDCLQVNRVAQGSAVWNGSVMWLDGMPHHGLDIQKAQPYCYFHLQGPAAKDVLMRPMLLAAGLEPTML
ncbi:hypothetical protein AB1Y20_003885 [Prymnesium parvum]|uniref:Hexosyltransferase n=1 Tax=Prymnesium parvum TaxID=97485 RepID=A0AB34J671_PRYPA